MSKQTYLKNTAWERIGESSDDDALKEYMISGGSKMKDLPFSPIKLSDNSQLSMLTGNYETKKILDFGCGIGRNFKHYKRFYKEVHGYDLTPMVDKCKTLSDTTIDLLTSDWNTILLNRYDLVAAQFVFQHFTSATSLLELIQDLQDVCRYLYVSGRCYMDTPNHNSVFDIIFKSNLFEYVDSNPKIDKLLSTKYPEQETVEFLFKSNSSSYLPIKINTYNRNRCSVLSDSKKTPDIKSRIKKTKNEEVEIIILAKDNYNLTHDCILSIVKNVKYPEYHITICDTGSLSETIGKYEDLMEDIPNLRYRSFSDYNFSKNYNKAIEDSDSSYIVILNNDTVALNDFVSEMMKYILNNKVGAVGCQLVYPDNTVQHAGQTIFDTNTGKIQPYIGHHLLGSKVKSSGNYFIDGVTCACMLISKDVYEAVGGMLTSYNDIYQDVDLNLMIRKHGYEIYLTNNTKMIHYDNSTRNKEIGLNGLAKYMYKDADTFQELWANKRMVKKTSRGVVNFARSPVFSFVTLITDEKEYGKFLDSVETDIEHEFIGIKNYNNFFDSPTGLNVGAELSSGKYIVFCHQDVLLCDKWCEKVLNHIRMIETKDAEWGVLGIAGVCGDKSIDFLTNYPHSTSNMNTKEVYFEEAETVDELLILCKNYYKSNTDREYFDTSLNGFHFYGPDLCINHLYNYGAKSYIINCPVEHGSVDGSKNLQTKTQWRGFVKSAERFRKKWSKRGMNRISTTTCFMDAKEIRFHYRQHLDQSNE